MVCVRCNVRLVHAMYAQPTLLMEVTVMNPQGLTATVTPLWSESMESLVCQSLSGTVTAAAVTASCLCWAESNPSTFQIEYHVKLSGTITPGCLFVSDQKFSEQLQCVLKIFKTKPLGDFFEMRIMRSR